MLYREGTINGCKVQGDIISDGPFHTAIITMLDTDGITRASDKLCTSMEAAKHHIDDAWTAMEEGSSQ